MGNELSKSVFATSSAIEIAEATKEFKLGVEVLNRLTIGREAKKMVETDLKQIGNAVLKQLLKISKTECGEVDQLPHDK
jgi:hypothetical protein